MPEGSSGAKFKSQVSIVYDDSKFESTSLKLNGTLLINLIEEHIAELLCCLRCISELLALSTWTESK